MRALAPGEEEQNEGPYYETDFPCSSVPVLTKRDYLGSHELHDMRRISWDKVLTRLIAFLDKSGGRYPRQNPSNGDHEEKFLGHFVNRQRTQARSSDSKRKGRLTRERVEKLESLPNWRWAARKPGARHTLRAPVNITAGGPAPARASCTWSDSTPGKLEPLLQLQNRRVRDTSKARGGTAQYIGIMQGPKSAADNLGVLADSGNHGLVFKSCSGDFAEWHAQLCDTGTERELVEGDIVGFFNGMVSLRTSGAKLIGVVSTRAIVVGSVGRDAMQTQRERGAMVAYCGRVPVRVDGNVVAGDVLVPSGRHDGAATVLPRRDPLEACFSTACATPNAWSLAEQGGRADGGTMPCGTAPSTVAVALASASGGIVDAIVTPPSMTAEVAEQLHRRRKAAWGPGRAVLGALAAVLLLGTFALASNCIRCPNRPAIGQIDQAKHFYNVSDEMETKPKEYVTENNAEQDQVSEEPGLGRNVNKLDWVGSHALHRRPEYVQYASTGRFNATRCMDDDSTGAWLSAAATCADLSSLTWCTTGAYIAETRKRCPAVCGRCSTQAAGTASCWEAYRPDYYTICSHYTEVGYTCVGDYCAAMDPAGTPFTCAIKKPVGYTVEATTGRCVASAAVSDRSNGTDANATRIVVQRMVDMLIATFAFKVGLDNKRWRHEHPGLVRPFFIDETGPSTSTSTSTSTSVNANATSHSEWSPGRKEAEQTIWGR